MALPLCRCCTGARNEHACRQSLLGLLGSIKKKVQLSLPMACMFILFFLYVCRTGYIHLIWKRYERIDTKKNAHVLYSILSRIASFFM